VLTCGTLVTLHLLALLRGEPNVQQQLQIVRGLQGELRSVETSTAYTNVTAYLDTVGVPANVLPYLAGGRGVAGLFVSYQLLLSLDAPASAALVTAFISNLLTASVVIVPGCVTSVLPVEPPDTPPPPPVPPTGGAPPPPANPVVVGSGGDGCPSLSTSSSTGTGSDSSTGEGGQTGTGPSSSTDAGFTSDPAGAGPSRSIASCNIPAAASAACATSNGAPTIAGFATYLDGEITTPSLSALLLAVGSSASLSAACVDAIGALAAGAAFPPYKTIPGTIAAAVGRRIALVDATGQCVTMILQDLAQRAGAAFSCTHFVSNNKHTRLRSVTQWGIAERLPALVCVRVCPLTTSRVPPVSLCSLAAVAAGEAGARGREGVGHVLHQAPAQR
jgi:hypothetical protein